MAPVLIRWGTARQGATVTETKRGWQRCGGIGASLRRKAHKTSQNLQTGLKNRNIAPNDRARDPASSRLRPPGHHVRPERARRLADHDRAVGPGLRRDRLGD